MTGVRRTKAGVRIGLPGLATLFPPGDVAAAGSTQANGTTLSYTVNNVTAADGTKAVVLPAITRAGQFVAAYNSVATNGLPIFPASGAAINGGTADAAVTIEGKTLAIFFATSLTNWSAVYTANS